MSSSQVTTRRSLDLDRVSAFVAARHGSSPDAIQLDVTPLRGGLDAVAVARIRAQIDRVGARPTTATFVVKRLDGPATRESTVYSLLHQHDVAGAPRMLGADSIDAACAYLYLEHVRPRSVWPWGEAGRIGKVVDELARVHASLPAGGEPFADAWYERGFVDESRDTLELLEQVAYSWPQLRPMVRAARRVASSAPTLRRQLLELEPFGTAVLHGDVHTGNVVLRARSAGDQVVFLDWARARIGSPLEDLASWLQSLAFWEPVARQRHETLFRRYLVARGLPDRLGRTLRDAFWLAAACNALSGALRYHLATLSGWGAPTPAQVEIAFAAARDHLRILRRADACWSA